MTKTDFLKLYYLLRNKLEPDPRAVRPLPLEIRVDVAIYSLGSTMDNRVTAITSFTAKSRL